MVDIQHELINQGGTIPYELQNLTILEVIAFEQGNIVGTIPSQFGNIPSLKVIDLDFQNLVGTIPDSVYGLPNLNTLDLNDNNLTGTISTKIGNLKELSFVQLGNDRPGGANNFTGTLPTELGSLPNLGTFTANNNSFTGPLPDLTDDGSLLWLDVSNNQLTGPIDTTDWSKLPKLIILDLSSNDFTGKIPATIGGDTKLDRAFFDDNNLTGAMPPQVCALRNGFLQQLTADCAGSTPQVTCKFPECCTACFL